MKSDADVGFADEGAQPGTENRQRQAGRHLIGQQNLRQDRKGERHGRAGKGCGEDAKAGTAGRRGGGEADHRAHQYHALDAQVQDTGFLRHQFAGCRQQQGCSGTDDRHHDGNEPGEFSAHEGDLAGRCVGACRAKRSR